MFTYNDIQSLLSDFAKNLLADNDIQQEVINQVSDLVKKLSTLETAENNNWLKTPFAMLIEHFCLNRSDNLSSEMESRRKDLYNKALELLQNNKATNQVGGYFQIEGLYDV